MSSIEAAKALLAEEDSQSKQYVRAVGPRLRWVLMLVFGLFALLGANALYLASVTFLGWYTQLSYEDLFYQYMFLAHLVLGVLLLAPFMVFGIAHMLAARNRRNRRAVRIGYALLAVSTLLLVSGLLLMRVGVLEIRDQTARAVCYWLHVASPLAAIWLYWLHRLAGPRIKWKAGLTYLGAVGAVVAVMLVLRSQDPRQWNQQGPAEGVQYFEPSLTRTASGGFIPARVLMNDQYCMQCHPDVYEGWVHSVHHFSSFNNPTYLHSVRETREAALKRDGNVKASRWCAGCHDPVPFLSGAFDQPDFDDVNDPTAHAGITCTVCHAITHVNSNRGNGDYTIEEPLHYPFAFSESRLLRWVNATMVKAKPEFHKKTFLKPFHKTAEFCSTCHKVHLPFALNHYKEFLRGQNHYDSYHLSGVSGHGARSFYYPPQSQENCNGCHMPGQLSDDFAAKPLPGVDGPAIHDHLFPGANTAVPWLLGDDTTVRRQQEFLQDGVMRVDLFGIKEGADINGRLHAPLRPELPTLKPGASYLLETVIRTVKMGHHFTQGTTDSNEIWLELEVRSGGRLIAHSGARDAHGEVDRNSHFVNNFVIDREGNRISRRNPQDIFTTVYNHQIPPGAGQTVHYRLDVPQDVTAPLEIRLRLNYRKFDKEYFDFLVRSVRDHDLAARSLAAGKFVPNPLPITLLAEDRVVLPVEGADPPGPQEAPPWPAWQRWNDYGIGMLLKGQAELRQAAEAFRQIDRYDGPLNLARVLLKEGLLDEAGEAVRRAAEYDDPPAPSWTLAWLSGAINLEQGRYPEAQRNFAKVLTDTTEEMRRRGFDFSQDYVVIGQLGQTLYDQAKLQVGPERETTRRQFLEAAAEQFERVLEYDSENLSAHHNLHLIYSQLGRSDLAESHRRLHARYRPDDNAKAAVTKARQKYPAANHAAEGLVIYELPAVDDDQEASR